MGQRNKDCTLGYLRVEEVVGQESRALGTISLSGAYDDKPGQVGRPASGGQAQPPVEVI